MTTLRTVALSLALLTATSLARAADPLLGSPDFKASPTQPLGWRGDGSGRYPGATPPTEWARWAKTSIRDTRSQAAKPKAESPDSAELLPFGRLENWLILGPIPVDDTAKALDDAILPDEASLRPDANEKLAGKPSEGEKLAWTPFKAGGDNQSGGAGLSGVEFYRALPHPPGSLASYAHTYLYAPEDLKATLALATATPAKAWLNGKLISTDPKGGRHPLTLDLHKGFNSILIKQVATLTDKPDSIHTWRFTATLEPADKSFTYDSKGIAWMTPLPAPSTSLPVVVGDKIFVNSAYADLLCINKADGKILWLRSNSYYDSLTDEERTTAGIKDQVDPLAARLQALNEDIVKSINDNITPAGLPTDQYKALADKFSAKSKLDIQISDLLRKNKITKSVPYIQHVGTSNGTPVTDGIHIWAIYGGGTYSGPLTVVCYDLTGKRIWARGYSDVAAGEHGTHCSPILADGKLVVQTIDGIGVLDAASGKDIWSGKPQGMANNGGGSPTCTRIGDTWVVIGPRRDIYRLDNGKVLYVPDAQQLGHSVNTPVIDRGILYQIVGWSDANYSAFQLPDAYADSLKLKQLYRVSAEVGGKYKDATFVNSFIGSPLYDNGLVYNLTEGGVLHVSDAATGAPAYIRMMDEMRTRVQWVFWNGACGSPVLAGKNIYITDDNGITVIIEPGRTFKKIAVNTLENYNDGFSQEQTLGTPVFEGTHMFYRTPGYLYSIGPK